jgi:solute carrier family 35 (UDP-sugar transporter), member A1/2/3
VSIIGWNVNTWLSVALVPAGLYAIQNMASLTAYQNLDPFTYNTLNQTKTLSAAFCCYIVMGRKQSWIQVFALLLLLLSALIMEGVVSVDSLLFGVHSNVNITPPVTNDRTELDGRRFTHGVVPILLASFISGLAGALSQKKLQQTTGGTTKGGGGGRDAYLFTMELCAATCIILLLSLVISSDGEKILANGFWDGWTIYTFIPIITNSAGGIIVGLVTKYAGSVRKGFALIFGIFLSGIIQAIMQSDKQISKEQILGGTIAAISLYLHAANPPAIIVKNLKQD